jgi:hypothetical protein
MVVFGAPAAEFPREEVAPEAPTVPFPLAAAVEVFVLGLLAAGELLLVALPAFIL